MSDVSLSEAFMPTPPPNIVAAIALPMNMERFGKLLSQITEHWPDAVVGGELVSADGTKLVLIWDRP
jgi:hypothetical protein